MKKIVKKIALVMVLVLSCTMVFGCSILTDTDTEDGKSILDDILEIMDDVSDTGWVDDGGSQGGFDTGDDQNMGGDLISTLFDAFFGGSSEDYGWGESSYSGGYSNYTGNSSAPASYSDVSSVASGNGSSTVLIYMIGSNLESESGCGTMDLQEMCKAGVGKNVNVLVEAGGAKKWQNSVISAGKLGRYKIENDGIVTVDQKKKSSMVTPGEITEFINWGVKNYPADSYNLIFWNHGGGTLAGFGSDELFSGDLSIGDIASAVKASNTHFNFIGFDACLMGTVETAYSLAPCADYLIASEEEEPGYGWYYTGWLKALEKNPKLDMKSLGKIIVDDFIADNKSGSTTLSVMDLSKVGDLYKSLCTLCSTGSKALAGGEYKSISTARNKSKAFGDGNYDQIDIVDFCNKCGLAGADKVVEAVNDVLVYHNTNMSRTNGIAMYFPYNYPSYYKQMLKMEKGFGMTNSSYNGFFSDFLSVKSSGYTSRALSPMEVKTDYSEDKEEVDYSVEDWFSQLLVDETDEAPVELDDTGVLELTDKGDYYAVCFSEDDYDKIIYSDLSLYYDDGEGYIDMGYDNMIDIDEDGDYIVSSDNTWVAINGKTVPYYVEDEIVDEDGSWMTYGYTYAELTSARTGETFDIQIMLCWDSEHDGGYVLGYRDGDDDFSTPGLAERSVRNFIKGDKIQILCDYYDYEGNYDDEYYYEEPIVVDSALVVSYEDLGDNPIDVCAHFIDIYGNEYWSESVTLN